MIKVGDKVRVIDQEITGTVVEDWGNLVVIEEEDFEFDDRGNLVVIEEEDSEVYDNRLEFKKSELEKIEGNENADQ
tara:strand:+ start:1094 stop:1321 length:228 start_codon:yes stop_codon:yes gene_type:complete